MRVYIAGPMTGLPEFNFPAFNAMADKLRAAGWHVENPADHGHVEGAGWADYLRYDIGRLATCEVVMLLPGWTQSRGARLEVSIARALGIGLMYADGAEYKPATEACEFPQSCTTRCDFDIPDFSPGNGNKARRRAAAIEALKPENQRVVPVLPGDPLSTCLGCFGTGTISTGIEEASSTICNGCNGTGREQA
ncbi:MAG: DUF4406 domain-containing protein [Pseudomonas umsongensis]|nr:DUF4406 domain-containing protein [Pseudomonas umsongensis]